MVIETPDTDGYDCLFFSGGVWGATMCRITSICIISSDGLARLPGRDGDRAPEEPAGTGKYVILSRRSFRCASARNRHSLVSSIRAMLRYLEALRRST